MTKCHKKEPQPQKEGSHKHHMLAEETPFGL